jgi:glycosyltransferase involved in cell wall biosynthesis
MGGPTRVLIDLAEYQRLAGHSITICTTDRGSPSARVIDRQELAGLFSAEIAVKCFSVSFSPLLFSRTMAFWLSENLRKFDLAHIHGLYRFPQTYAARRARLLCVPYVIRPHGSLDPYLYRQSSRNLIVKRIYERLFDFPNLQAASAIHYTAEEERNRAAFLGLRPPSFVLPNGIDWRRFTTLPERGAFRKSVGLGDERMVLFLGRLNFKKGLDLLVTAMAQVVSELGDVKLVIVGPDNEGYGNKVRSWVSSSGIEASVRFVGPLGVDAVVSAYVDADVFALPSYTENFGLAVVEAMACRTPVVISDQVNIYREVVAAGAGLVTRCDADELSCALIRLLCDSNARKGMGESGRRMARERYAWPAIVQALTEQYESIVSRAA